MSLSIYAQPLQQQLTARKCCALNKASEAENTWRVQRCTCPLLTENMQVLGVCWIVKLFGTLRRVWF